jgi:hypothetical protein
MSQTTGWRALIPVLDERAVRILAADEAAGTSQRLLMSMAQNAALEYRFQTDCDRLYETSGGPTLRGVDHSEWWPPGEGHEVTYRYVTLSTRTVVRPLVIQVLAEVEITGEVAPMTIEMTIDQVSQDASVRLSPQDARDAAACLIEAAERIEAVDE